MRRTLGVVVCVVAVLAGVALAAPARAEYQSDGGYLDQGYDQGAPFGTQTINWVWVPHYPPGTVQYVLFARCFRSNEQTDLGENKVVFKKGSANGLTSQTSVRLPTLKGKLDDGGMDWLRVEVPGLAAVAGDDAVLVQVPVQVKGQIGAGEFVFCQADITESTTDLTTVSAPRDLR